MEAFVMITLLGTELPYPWAHIPERVLYKGDCVKSGYSEVMIAQFILNIIAGCSNRVLMYVGHMLFLTLYMRIASMSCSHQFCRVDSPAVD